MVGYISVFSSAIHSKLEAEVHVLCAVSEVAGPEEAAFLLLVSEIARPR